MVPTRVEWTRLSGEDAETVLSVLLYSQNPSAVRVRPSIGDGGVDVLVPNLRQPTRVDIYQIKRFASNLTSNQKNQIDRSYRRLALQVAQDKVPAANWYLLMPLDPTPENRTWFSGVGTRALDYLLDASEHPERYPRDAITGEGLARVRGWQEDPQWSQEWKGLVACEALASSYPHVVDYYLHGGSAKVDSAVRQVAALLSTDRELRRASDGPDVQPADLREHLRSVQEALDTDPHYRYGIALDPTAPAVESMQLEPGLIAAAQEIAPDGRCLTFRIFARFTEAVYQRPIPLDLTFVFAQGTDELEDFRQWHKYGKPTTLPVKLKADLPGGLGGTYENATITMGPPADGQSYKLRYRLVSADHLPLAHLVVEMEPPAKGLDGTGQWNRGADATGTVQFESFYDIDSQKMRLNVLFGDLAGAPVTDALPACEFRSHWQAGNSLEFSGEQGPFHRLFTLSDEIESSLDPLVLRVITALRSIQDVVPAIIHIPDLALMPIAQVREILRTESLCQGQVVIATWQEAAFQRRDDALTPGRELEVEILHNYQVDTGLAKHFLGVSTTKLTSATLVVTEDGHVLKPESDNRAITTLDLGARKLPSGVPNVNVSYL